MARLKIFISSVQHEFTEERKALSRHFSTDALLSSFFEAVLFEELPAACQAPDKVYVEEVEQSQVYLLLVGKDYGYEDAEGVSPTEREFEHARAHHLDSFAFIKGHAGIERHVKEQGFLLKIQNELSYKRFETIQELIYGVNAALLSLLKHKGLVQLSGFDESFHPTAQLSDIDPAKVDNFLGLAGYKRGFPLKQGSATEKVLTHLHFLTGDKLCNSALLAFGRVPQQFFPTAVTKCAHFHGYHVEKPIPDHKVFQGDVFEQVDQAVDFVLSKISVSVGTREQSNQAPIEYEIPRAVVTEAIVNAIAHRDYTSKGSVQIMLFKDRLEIYNPGRLTPELSIAKLRVDHCSYPTNPRLAEPMYQAGYIERFGTGTGEMYRLTERAGLEEPLFELEEGFKVIIGRPGHATVQATDQATDQVDELVKRLILVLIDEKNRQEIMDSLDLRHVPNFRDNYLNPSLEGGYIEMTIPDKPNNPIQKYRLTEKGNELKEAFYNAHQQATDHDTDYDTDYDTVYDTVYDTDHDEDLIGKLIGVLTEQKSRNELMNLLDLHHAGNFRDNYLSPAIEAGYVEMTLPETPKSKKQEYRLTAKGIELKKKLERKI